MYIETIRRMELSSSKIKVTLTCLFISYYILAAITCPQLPTSSNDATITCSGSDPASLGDECTYVCDNGFFDQGDGKITCNDDGDGTGSFTTPSCARKLMYHN